MAIGGKPAAKALKSKGMQPSTAASKKTKSAFTAAKNKKTAKDNASLPKRK